jgi:hypothetical protein
MIRVDEADQNKYYFFILLTGHINGENMQAWSYLDASKFSLGSFGNDSMVLVKRENGLVSYWPDKDDIFLFENVDELMNFFRRIEEVDPRINSKYLILNDGRFPNNNNAASLVYINIEEIKW